MHLLAHSLSVSCGLVCLHLILALVRKRCGLRRAGAFLAHSTVPRRAIFCYVLFMPCGLCVGGRCLRCGGVDLRMHSAVLLGTIRKSQRLVVSNSGLAHGCSMRIDLFFHEHLSQRSATLDDCSCTHSSHTTSEYVWDKTGKQRMFFFIIQKFSQLAPGGGLLPEAQK